jgi:hypothetical protein
MGVLSALPVVNVGNACCCMWVVAGGLVAAYLLQQNQSTPITVADGALVGLLAGIVGAVVQFLISIPIGILVAPMERAMMQRALDMSGSLPPDLRSVIENYGARRDDVGIAGLVILRILSLFFSLCMGAIFSTLGGLLGAAIFRRRLPPGTVDSGATA